MKTAKLNTQTRTTKMNELGDDEYFRHLGKNAKGLNPLKPIVMHATDQYMKI